MDSSDIDSAFTDLDISLKERLKKAGFNSVKELAIRGPVDIARNAGIRSDEAASICNRASIILEEIGVITNNFSGCNYDQKSNTIQHIATGSENLDRLFGGNGIETQSITEFYGSSQTGKTQLCHTMCVSMQSRSPENKAIFIDTEGTFKQERIYQIADARGLDPERILQNIKYARVLNSARQESILEKECYNQIGTDDKIKLLIVDSFVNHYRAEYSGRDMLAQRQHRMNKSIHLLQNIAQTHNIAVIITNQIHASPDSFRGNLDKPVGGNVISHNVANSICLGGCFSSIRYARMVKGHFRTTIEAQFAINEAGVTDPTNSSIKNAYPTKR